MMKLWVIGYGIPNEKYPLNGVFAYNQAKGIATFNTDINVTYIGLDIRSIRRWRRWGIHCYEKDGMKIIDFSFPVGKVPVKMQGTIYSWALKRTVKKILSVIGTPDIVHGHFTEIGYAIVNNKKLIQAKKYIITEHSSGINTKDINPDIRKMAKITYSNMDKVFAVSPNFVSKIKAEFGVEALFIPNAINEDNFFWKKECTNTSKDFSFISVGRIVEGKNFPLLIEAFKCSFSKNEKVTLTIIGDGPDYENVRKLVKDYGLEDKIFLPGFMDEKHVAIKMRESNCFVFASNSETFGAVCAEALMCGKPVISTKCGGPDCMINSDNGILIPVGDMLAMSQAMTYMFKNINSYNAEVISNNATQLYSKKNVIDMIVKNYVI